MISLDIKCPSSDMNDKMLYKNLYFLQKKDQIKFVIKDYADYEFSKDIIKKYKKNVYLIKIKKEISYLRDFFFLINFLKCF